MAEFQLTHAQQGMWFLERFSGTSFVDPMTFRLVGDLDADALRWSLRELVGRHEALRTRFPVTGGRPAQEVVPADRAGLAVPLTDLSELPPAERESELERLLREDQDARFDLARGPVVRAALHRLGPREHVVRITTHHIVSDAVSWWSVLFRELERLYAARLAGRPSPLEPVTTQYAAFVRWQREWLESPAATRELAYWRRELEGVTPLPELALARPREDRPARRGPVATRWLTFPQPLYDGLREFAARERATPYMVLLTAFTSLLHRHTGAHDILVGTRAGFRGRPEFEHTVGFLVNLLPLRTRVPENADFRSLLQAVRRSTLGAYVHRTVPFERLVADLGLQRRGSRPVVNVCVSFQSTPEVPPALDGLEATLINHDPFSAFDLDLGFYEDDGSLRALLTHDPAQYDDEAAQSLLDDLQQVLTSALHPIATKV
ncbi:condensation domain-containing protein [Streptomyces antarcticus]|uniref:condensation domain-containing protein n=1 Tax=Streptomyces antarcticus TaxID=2996458 RepID=UPI00226D4490|nr:MULTISPECIES: condensation domain-containing protein [unclassified Streptomyces]MCY0944139.1 condensation domain-containing protein [Streptomyces sp. H34-AA3]MCY0950444.1 condensation domain-containing protein [Streptomyces sp. H27-S2]MCZ4086733.1 condensation domain-containing protein [Streptomyces sp. H34-S5]